MNVAHTSGTEVTWRRKALVLTAFLAAAITLIAEAMSEYMLVPIQEDMSLTVDEVNRLALMPETVGLIAVFLAGALALRFGRRIVISAGALSFAAGAVLVMVAPNVTVLIAGRVLCGIGSVTLAVLGLSLINITFTDPGQRARAFGVLGAITPLVFIISPTVSAWMSETIGWRYVPLVWLACAFTLLVLALGSVPAALTKPTRQELVTPLLAGLALTALCIAASTLISPGPITVIALVISFASTLALVVLLRRLKTPTLDLRSLRAPGSLLAAGAIIMALAVNISFFIGLYTEYRYEMPAAMGSMLLALPEVAGIAGSLLFGSLAARIGAARSATIAMATAGVMALAVFAITPTSPVGLVIVIAIFVNMPIAGAFGPLAENFLNFAPDDGSDAASSIHDALTNVSFVLGGILVGTIAFTGFQQSLTSQMQEAGVTAARADALASEIRNGAVVAEVVDRSYATEPGLYDLLLVEGGGLNIAQVEALRRGAVMLTGASLIGAGMLVASSRRRRAFTGGLA